MLPSGSMNILLTQRKHWDFFKLISKMLNPIVKGHLYDENYLCKVDFSDILTLMLYFQLFVVLWFPKHLLIELLTYSPRHWFL